MFAQMWYVTKFLHISAAVGFAVGVAMVIAPRFHPTSETGRVRQAIERKEVRVLPVTLPQGRLYCVEGVVMHERMYPRSLQQIASADAIEVMTGIADEACARSLRTAECKAAQAKLTALRRALRSCRA